MPASSRIAMLPITAPALRPEEGLGDEVGGAVDDDAWEVPGSVQDEEDDSKEAGE
jgi:hypothetical protein